MLKLPDSVKTEADVQTFFAGVRAGLLMADGRLGKKMRSKDGVEYSVSIAHLVTDCNTIEKLVIDNMRKAKRDP